ncbi:MAG TPA: hypothetical protein VFK05_30780 [Polyangiaceae bacterium]|nr:hypothetical protein [Polyangiaceae bacterium]
MRSASAAQLTSLFGSLALHACVMLVLVLAARRQPLPVVEQRERPDPWLGASAVEVDAVATPEATPNIANAANSAESESESAAAKEEAAKLTVASDDAAPQTANAKPSLEHAPTAVALPAARAKPPQAKPRPRPRRPADPSSGSAAAATPPAAAGSHEQNTPAATGTFGSPDLPPGVRSLPGAFARAIPPATGADPIWQSLPTGKQKPFILAVEVDAEGHIASAKILGSHDGEETPPQFEHLRQRVIALLGGGLFALQNNGTAGRDLFRITITLSDRAVREDSGPAELVERGFEPPRGNSPGRAYFTLASGRHFEARVEVLGSPARPQHP